MKFIQLLALLLVVSIFSFQTLQFQSAKTKHSQDIFLQVSEDQPTTQNQDEKLQAPQPEDEQYKKYKSLIDKIYEYSEELSKNKEDPQKRRIKAGILPNFYPKAQREQALKMAQEKKKKGYALKYLTEPYRFCIFPSTEINSMTYCDNTFKRLSETRAKDCNHMMCVNCCNHLLLTLKFVSSQSIVSETLSLADDSGYNKIKSYVTPDVIQRCRNTCDVEFPTKKPVVLPPPPKDPTLGTTAQNPAKSCIDIKMNSIDPKDGVYFVQSGQKPAMKVYCDMTTNGGGWTLFFSYSHHPYEDYQLDATKMPIDPKNSRSHFNLEQAGFDAFDVTQLRFFCTTTNQLNKKNRFINFKTSNPDLIKVAMLGDQAHLSPLSWTRGFQNIDLPSELNVDQYVRANFPKDVTQVTKTNNGGFWNTPFGSPDGEWTIKGPARSGGFWQCGDKLDPMSGAKYETLHQVWFRGQPPTLQFLQNRALQKIK